MLEKLVVILLLLISSAMAESIRVGSYSFTFDMKIPHQIDYNTIKTRDGQITIYDNVPVRWDGVHAGNVGNDYYLTKYNDWYTARPLSFDASYSIESNMDLTDIVEFLETLKVEKIS